jgi:hypothetical protein
MRGTAASASRQSRSFADRPRDGPIVTLERRMSQRESRDMDILDIRTDLPSHAQPRGAERSVTLRQPADACACGAKRYTGVNPPRRLDHSELAGLFFAPHA